MKKKHLLSKLVSGSPMQTRKVPRTWTGINIENAVYKAICDILDDSINHLAMETEMLKREIVETAVGYEPVRKQRLLKDREDMMAKYEKLYIGLKKLRDNVGKSLWSNEDDDFKIEVKKPRPEYKPKTVVNL